MNRIGATIYIYSYCKYVPFFQLVEWLLTRPLALLFRRFMTNPSTNCSGLYNYNARVERKKECTHSSTIITKKIKQWLKTETIVGDWETSKRLIRDDVELKGVLFFLYFLLTHLFYFEDNNSPGMKGKTRAHFSK